MRKTNKNPIADRGLYANRQHYSIWNENQHDLWKAQSRMNSHQWTSKIYNKNISSALTSSWNFEQQWSKL